jgi:membrane associated rhomboid family serine protease
VLFPNTPLFLFFIPVPIPAKYAVIGLGVLAFYFSATGTLPGIANIAHLGGLLFGLLALKGPRWLRRLLS